jgi:hypothetical protein
MPAIAGLFDIDFVEQILEGQQIALMTQAADDADGQVGKWE